MSIVCIFDHALYQHSELYNKFVFKSIPKYLEMICLDLKMCGHYNGQVMLLERKKTALSLLCNYVLLN